MAFYWFPSTEGRLSFDDCGWEVDFWEASSCKGKGGNYWNSPSWSLMEAFPQRRKKQWVSLFTERRLKTSCLNQALLRKPKTVKRIRITTFSFALKNNATADIPLVKWNNTKSVRGLIIVSHFSCSENLHIFKIVL